MSLNLVRSVLFFSALGTICPTPSQQLWAQSTTAEVSITTFNIKYYGLNGDHDGEPGDESRDNTIKAHLNRYDLWTDVIIFQEIVDVTSLKSLVGSNYLCRSYDNEDPRHQHVVICYKKKFSLSLASDDDNYVLEEVAMQRYRPVVHGILKLKNGGRLLHIFGVHLKAQPDRSDIREEQTHMIADFLETRSDEEPVVIVGDFNTHNNDSTMMSNIYRREGVNLIQAANSNQFTYRSGSNGSKLDRFWISKSLKITQNPKVSGPCNSVAGSNQAIKDYNLHVSDHCPVTMKVKTKISQ